MRQLLLASSLALMSCRKSDNHTNSSFLACEECSAPSYLRNFEHAGTHEQATKVSSANHHFFSFKDLSIQTIEIPANIANGLQFNLNADQLSFRGQTQGTNEMGFHSINQILVNWNIETQEIKTTPQSSYTENDNNDGFLKNEHFRAKDSLVYHQAGSSYMLIAKDRAILQLYQLPNMEKPLKELKVCKKAAILDIAINPEQNHVAVICMQDKIHLIDLASFEIIASSVPTNVELNKYTTNPKAISFISEKEVLVFDSSGYAVTMKPSESDKMILQAKLVAELSATDLAVSPKLDSFASVSFNNQVELRKLDGSLLREPIKLNLGENFYSDSLSYSPDGQKLYVGSYPSVLSEIDLASGRIESYTVSESPLSLHNLVVSPQGDRVAFASGGIVQIVNLDSQLIYDKACTWLRPRLAQLSNLSPEERAVCP